MSTETAVLTQRLHNVLHGNTASRPSLSRKASEAVQNTASRPSLSRKASEAVPNIASRPSLSRKASEAAQKTQLLLWNQLPEWQQIDQYIQSGYRKSTPSFWECVRSWLYLHNETVNIFSHLIGALLFVVLPFTLYVELSSRYFCPKGDMTACAVFMYGVATCFALSATFHTCACHSQKGYQVARHLDFQGIIILVMATSAPQTYYTFYNDVTLQRRYWAFMAVFGILASITTFSRSFYKPSGNLVRVLVFAGMGLATFAPNVHGIYAHGWQGQSERFSLWCVALTHSFNIFGAVVYSTHFPERWWPRKFDLFGASHQLMHCAIVGAALTLLVGTIQAFDHANPHLLRK